jgi:hypothetical protein
VPPRQESYLNGKSIKTMIVDVYVNHSGHFDTKNLMSKTQKIFFSRIILNESHFNSFVSAGNHQFYTICYSIRSYNPQIENLAAMIL